MRIVLDFIHSCIIECLYHGVQEFGVYAGPMRVCFPDFRKVAGKVGLQTLFSFPFIMETSHLLPSLVHKCWIFQNMTKEISGNKIIKVNTAYWEGIDLNLRSHYNTQKKHYTLIKRAWCSKKMYFLLVHVWEAPKTAFFPKTAFSCFGKINFIWQICQNRL